LLKVHNLLKAYLDIGNNRTYLGRRIQYVPGWDCHGLPIEIKALEQYRASSRAKASLNAVDIRNIARSLATKTVQDQKNRFQDWAILADWKNAWMTMDKNFEIGQLRVFQEMVKRGLIFRRYKPVYWSPSSKTALAEAELEYKDDHESTAAFVKYSMLSIPQCLIDQGVDAKRLRALIWTTTPWTLPANRAIAIHPDLDYVVVEVGSEQLLIAESRLEYICELCSFNPQNISIARFKGSLLEGSTYLSIFNGSASTPQPLILTEFVSADSGSGLVHCAPGHGGDDYEACMKHGIAAFAPVDDAGCFTDLAFPDDPRALTGRSVLDDGNTEVLKFLGDKVLLVHKYIHKYPYDWRSKLPVIVRATEQWFAAVGSIKNDALTSLEDVEFIPPSGEARLKAFVIGRSEWCISRQRSWGVPIPALYDENGKAILTEQSVAHIISVIMDRGTDAWWTDAEDDPTWIAPGLNGSYRRGKDTMDVWFDSGSSWTQTEGRADVYSEGTDQHRGWFQSSLLTYVSASGRQEAPFRKLITHGFTLDQEGRKMSKSIGNVISPTQIMDGSLLPRVSVQYESKHFTLIEANMRRSNIRMPRVN
jgi:isoleucyl-tRNA synthetase